MILLTTVMLTVIALIMVCGAFIVRRKRSRRFFGEYLRQFLAASCTCLGPRIIPRSDLGKTPQGWIQPDWEGRNGN